MKINTRKAIEYILKQMYFSEFEVMDGINQHPNGWSFDRWLEDKGLIGEDCTSKQQRYIY